MKGVMIFYFFINGSYNKFKLIYTIKKLKNGFVAENKDFNIFGYGNTIEKAEKELFKYVNDIYECYAKEDDKNLDENAIKLKVKLLKHIIKIK